MLEYYGDYDAAARLLKNYAYDESFPPNPNALVYLYEFMRRHSAPENKSLRVLQVQLWIHIHCYRNESF